MSATRLLPALLCLALAGSATAQRPAGAPQAGVNRPRLLVLISVDQFRNDYLYRFQETYSGGLKRLTTQGAVFTNAHLEHFPTVTAIGHSVLLTGAPPSLSGIVGNEWYDRASQGEVTSVSDPATRLLGGSGPGSSPHRLLVGAIGDALKQSGRGSPKVIGISMKDRAAILPAGRSADAAYWFDNKTGNMVSSTYYFAELPAWVRQFNERRTADQWKGKPWLSIENPQAPPLFTMPAEADEKYWGALQRSPFGNDLVEMFAEEALTHERLGQNAWLDVLTVSFSANDYVGHQHGPQSPLVRDMSIQTDRMLDRFFRFLDTKVGLRNVLVVFTADHGLAPLPEQMKQARMPGGRVPPGLADGLNKALSERWGPGRWVAGGRETAVYLNHDLIAAKGLERSEVRRAAADYLCGRPHALRCYTWDQLATGGLGGDAVDQRVRNGFNPQRSADVIVINQPYWVLDRTGTGHGMPFSYDSHVPLILMGPGIRPGRRHRKVSILDLAPTLATMFEVETPAGALGGILEEVIPPAGSMIR